MRQQIFFPFVTMVAATITATTAILGLPAPAKAQGQSRIGDLQQRTNGITISGEVMSVVGNDFVLSDGSGEIIVDAGPLWWQEINLSPGDRITVMGEVGRAGEFDAFSITRADGTVIQIRSPQGPPPWAGGPNHR